MADKLDLSSKVILVGMMGSGKSTVAPLLAAALGVGHVDLDQDLEAARGMSVQEMFEAWGEPEFRRLEAQTLDRLLAKDDPTVLSLGGGALEDEASRSAVSAQPAVIWLRASVSTLIERLGDGRGRPMLAGGSEAALTRLSTQREALYLEAAAVVVEVDGLEPGQVVERILELA